MTVAGRRALVPLAILSLVVAVMPRALPAASAQDATAPVPGSTVMVSVPSGGGNADAPSVMADDANTTNRSISGDGRYVAFASRAGNLAPGADGTTLHAYVHDRMTVTTELVSSTADGSPAGDSGDAFAVGGSGPVLSSDGRYVVFSSSAQNLHPCGQSGFEVYRKDLQTGAVVSVTTLVTAGGRCEGGGGSEHSVSGDGAVVTFWAISPFDYERGLRWDDPAHPNQTPRDEVPRHLYAYEVTTGGYELLTVDSAGNPAVLPSDGRAGRVHRAHPDATGRRVAFTSRLAGLGPAVGPGSYVYLRDRDQRMTTRIASTITGDGRQRLGLSDDGNVIAFATTDGLVQDDLHGGEDIYVRDLRTGVDERVSRTPEGSAFSPTGLHTGVSVSGDGRYVVFGASRFGSGEAQAVWRRDRGDPTQDPPVPPSTIAVSVTPDGTPAQGVTPAITPDGTQVAFASDEALVDDAPAGRTDVFVRDLLDCPGPFDSPSTSFSQEAPTCPLPELQLVGLEVTQGIQNLRGEAPLIAGRRTWVRAHVRVTGAERMPVVRARLVGTRADRVLLPLTSTIDVVASPARTDVRQSYQFELPREWTFGPGETRIEFQGLGNVFTCRDPGEDCTTVARFSFGPILGLLLLGLEWEDAQGGLHGPGPEAIRQAVHQARALLPVERVMWVQVPNLPPGRLDPVGNPSLSLAAMTRQIAEVEWQRLRNGCPYPLSSRCYHVGVLTDLTDALPANAGVLTTGASRVPSDSVLAFVDPLLPRNLTLAHELGHAAGRQHVRCRGTEHDPDLGYPYPDGQLGGPRGGDPDGDDDQAFWGTDVYRFLGDGVIRHPIRHADLMSYCPEQWTSDYTWNAIRTTYSTRFQAAPRASTRQAHAEVLLMAGTLVDGAVTLQHLEPGVTSPTSEDHDGDLVVRLEDHRGEVLVRHRLSSVAVADHHGGDSPRTFVAAVPHPSGVARVVLERDGTDVATHDAGPATPTVELHEPVEGSVLDGTSTTARYTAADADGDPLDLTLDYSPDGGTTWLLAAHDLTGGQATVPLELLPGSTHALLRLRASDGLHVAEDIAGPFTVPDRPPVVVIDDTSQAVFTADGTVLLHADAHDPETGQLDEAALTWTSDRIPQPLGTGTTIAASATGLPLGRHVVTVTAIDPAGSTATDSVAVHIDPVLPRTMRLAGPERIATAVTISRATFGEGTAGGVVLARADAFPDALAGGPLAVAVDGPVLLSSVAALSPASAAELQRVLPAGGTVHVLGGEAALSATVAAEVAALGYAVVRHGGSNRFETAVSVAESGLGAPGLVVLADGGDFPDPLIASAAAAAQGGALLLTSGSVLPPETSAYLDRTMPGMRIAVGQPAVEAAPDARALAGGSPAATSVVVADALFRGHVAVGLATLQAFPDALAGGAHSGRLGQPLLLSDQAVLPGPVVKYLARGTGRGVVYLYGGTAALSEEVRAQASAALTDTEEQGP